MNCELPDVQAGFRNGRGARDQIVNIHWIPEKAKEFQENIYFCFIDYAKACDWSSDVCSSDLSLNIRKLTVHVLLKTSLENFEHYFASV